jgi:MFS family permease
MSQPAVAATERVPEFGSRYSAYALGLFVLVGAFNIVDRSIIGLLLQPIASDLALTDSQLGLFSGPAFGFFYALAQIPLAHVADHRRRTRLIALALAFWSVMTALQGAAFGFLTLLLARAAVGVGEAGSGPATQSLIADLFAPTKRATALAIYAIVLPLGVAIGVQIAGWGREALGWRGTLQLVGLPGLALAAVVWTTLREPTRGHWDTGARVAPASLRETALQLFGLRSFRHLVLGQSLSAFTYSCYVFDAVYLERSLAFTPVEIGSLFAVVSVIGIGATLLGGWIADRMSLRGASWPLRCAALFSTCYALNSFAYYIVARDKTTLVVISLVGAFLPGTLGVVWATAQSLAPAAMRARAAAVVLAVSTFVGALGPYVTGALSDALAASFARESMRHALLLVVVPGWLWCAAHFWLGSRALARDLAAGGARG